MGQPTHRTGIEDGWKVAEFRIGDTWHQMGQRFSTNITEAEVDGFAWAAREGYLLATDPTDPMRGYCLCLEGVPNSVDDCPIHGHPRPAHSPLRIRVLSIQEAAPVYVPDGDPLVFIPMVLIVDHTGGIEPGDYLLPTTDPNEPCPAGRAQAGSGTRKSKKETP